MRTLLFALTCMAFAGLSGVAHAAAQEEAPVDHGAAAANDWLDPNCPRRTHVRGAMAGPRACRTAYSAMRNCSYEIDVRASSLRYASGRRRHARIARCAPAPLNA